MRHLTDFIATKSYRKRRRKRKAFLLLWKRKEEKRKKIVFSSLSFLKKAKFGSLRNEKKDLNDGSIMTSFSSPFVLTFCKKKKSIN